MSLLGAEAVELAQFGSPLRPSGPHVPLCTVQPALGVGARSGLRRPGAPTTATTLPPAPVLRSATHGVNTTDPCQVVVGMIPMLTSRRSARLWRTERAHFRVRTLTSEPGGAGGRGAVVQAGESVVKSGARAHGKGGIPHFPLLTWASHAPRCASAHLAAAPAPHRRPPPSC